MKNRGVWLGAAVALLMSGVLWMGGALAYPEPHFVPQSWQLDFEHGAPSCIAVRLPGESFDRYYWYMTYTVTNNTGEDHMLIPESELLTDAGDLLRANQGLPPRVYETIQKALKNPLLKSPTEAVGKLLQGEDHAVDGILIWVMPDHDVNEVRVFFRGLSGEDYPVTDPVTSETVMLHRTFVMDYETPGSLERQPRKPWITKSEEWVVR